MPLSHLRSVSLHTLPRDRLCIPTTHARTLITSARHQSHENPLGLPRKNVSRNPNIAARMQRGLPEKRRIKDVRKVVAVSSAKGGVGKSTIAANLALAFARQGHKTGILDTDIFGPSIPTLFNLTDASEPLLSDENKLLPLPSYSISTMSMGYLIPADRATVWRGLMVTKALQQLLHEVAWPNLDILILDLPPGTGDVQLTIAQQIELDGAVLVSTPQALSLADVIRGLRMWKVTGVNVLGMVRNMSVFTCPGCGERHDIFNAGGGGADGEDSGVLKACREKGIELLADIPINGAICRDADRGVPSVVGEPEGEAAKVFMEVAKRIGVKVGL